MDFMTNVITRKVVNVPQPLAWCFVYKSKDNHQIQLLTFKFTVFRAIPITETIPLTASTGRSV
jgi:hypothetical protein